MNLEYINDLGSERSVEIPFTIEAIKRFSKEGQLILDVGGIPTNSNIYSPVINEITNKKCHYSVSDFRPCTYQGDFVTYNFNNQLFDIIMFISSLEHFPQCTEGDMNFRPNEDRKGFLKALSILKEGGYIFLTVPYGDPVWQPYHQNYDYNKLLELTEGAKIIESYTYKLKDNKWVADDVNNFQGIRYTTKAYGVGCFILQKK
jgi:SAM-dependent methyltransferase